MKKLFVIWLAAVLAMPLRAAESLTLPFMVKGSYEAVVSHCELSICGRTYKAMEVDGVCKGGRMLYVPDIRSVVFDNAVVESVSQRPILDFTSSSTFVVYIKGENHFELSDYFLRVGASLSLLGFPGTIGNKLTGTSKRNFISVGGDMTVTDLTINVQAQYTGFAGTPSGTRKCTLYLKNLELKLSGNSGPVSGFADVLTTGCGLDMSQYSSGAKVNYKKSDKCFRVDNTLMYSLCVSCQNGYTSVDTRSTAANGKWVASAVGTKSSTSNTSSTSATSKSSTATRSPSSSRSSNLSNAVSSRPVTVTTSKTSTSSSRRTTTPTGGTVVRRTTSTKSASRSK
ncbi:MAG: hypothetical protein IJ762_02365 [Bacteroidaceae bacterium]|nr:hypothetical protein [Bacteroidaceae bacterium]